MNQLPEAPFEVRLATTLFLALLGLANIFGAWQVRNFSSFTPSGVAATVAPEETGHIHHSMEMPASGEVPVDLNSLDQPRPRIDRPLLVQDSHVHIPMYAITAALLSAIVFVLRLSSRVRSVLVWAL